MKKKLLSFAFAGALCLGGFNAQAQKDVFEKGFSLRFGLNLPNASFGGFNQFNLTANMGAFHTSDGTTKYGMAPTSNGSKLGYSLQLGTMYFIDGIDLGDKMKIGIDVQFIDLNYIPVDYVIRKSIAGPIVGSSNFKFFQVGFMIGPTFSYSLVENMSFDVALKVNPAWSGFLGKYDLNDPSNPNQNYSDSYAGIDFIQFGFVPAFYFRYNVLLVGFEYNLMSGLHTMTSKNRSEQVIVQGFVNKTSMNRMKFIFGFKF